MKTLKRILSGLLVVAVISALGFVLWANDAAQPTDVALRAMETDSQVIVTQQAGFITFEPASQQATTGFIFYPGGRVDARAYAPVLRRIAGQGYFVAVVKVPLNLAFFDVNAADEVIGKYPGMEHWGIGGHSLGGVAAALYAKDHQEVIGAIAFWASYPADDALKDTNLQVLSVYGSNDGLATGDQIEASKALLPAQTQYVSIEGGNHAQFGSYGLQAGDNPASIPPEEQWEQIADATVGLLASLVK
ncbi:MAG: alpha/beta hydrolase [Anaerolineales bacterium]|nr:alpha/beta hydrolase [Anaerolineae bacterium]PWB75809.1 MAG: alpha/beta hydrolase [Anaerolineales bacterium]